MKPSLRSAFLLPIVLLFFSTAALGATVDPKVQSALNSAAPGQTVPIIVTFDTPEAITAVAQQAAIQGTTGVVRALRARAERSQGDVRALLRGWGKSYRPLWIINGMSLKAEPDLVRTLAASPGVKEVRFNGTVRLPEVRPAQATTFSNLEAVRAPEVWSQVTGNGVTVAIIDSGVDINHPLLASKWRGGAGGWFNPYASGCTTENPCTPCEANGSTPCDDPPDPDGFSDRGHGTAVAGIVLGGDAATITGVAPGANWIAAKIFREDGFADFDAIHAAFQWALNPDGDDSTNDAPAVVNNSWGLGEAINLCNDSSQVFRTDVRNLRAAGISVVFAAGNGGPAGSTSISPGNYPESLAVGAIDFNGVLAPFSARGPSACDGTIYPELVAPGVNVHTTASGGGFANLSGTSFSAPHLSGVLALLKEASLKEGLAPAGPANLEAAVRLSGRDLGPAGPDNDYGFGVVNAAGALQILRQPPAPAQLIFPENGATTAPSITFRWTPGTSPGGEVADTLLVSEFPDFRTTVAAAAPLKGVALLAGGGGFLVAWAALLLRHKRRWASVLAAFGIALLLSCGGGSGDGDDDAVAVAGTRTVSGLRVGTTYHWKVLSENSVGRTAESEVRTFTVR